MKNDLGLNPWLSMWVKPKATIRKIVDFNPNFRLFFLSVIYGLVSLFSLSQTFSLGLVWNFFIIILLCIIFSWIWGYIAFSFTSFFVYFTGKWLKGAAKYKEIRAALAWSSVPMIGSLFLWILLFIVFRVDLVREFPEGAALIAAQRGFLFIVFLAQLVFNIWILVLFINSLAEVQKFSIGKSILNILIAIAILVAVFFVFSIFLQLIFRGFNLK